MADFFQTGMIATLHGLVPGGLERMEGELVRFSAGAPVALVLPCHVRDLHSAALRGIVAELRAVPYLSLVVVGLDGPVRAGDLAAARRLFTGLPGRVLLVRAEGRRMGGFLRGLAASGVGAGLPGKGRNVWLCCGAVLAMGEARVVAVHDCDIRNYERGLLARLVWPVANRGLGLDFCKGFYARFGDRLHGRVMRLFMSPVLGAMREVLGPLPLLVWLGGFRYPLAGEVAMDVGLLRRVGMPCDWALEVGLLAEVGRYAARGAVCESEVCGNYVHKHQALSVRDPGRGLHRMAVDIARFLFARLAAEGVGLDAGVFAALQSAYVRHAWVALRCYAADAAFNGLLFPREDEEAAVAMFARCVAEAGGAFLLDPAGGPLMPGWDAVAQAAPGALGELRAVVLAEDAG